MNEIIHKINITRPNPKKIRARKTHFCEICSRVIMPGSEALAFEAISKPQYDGVIAISDLRMWHFNTYLCSQICASEFDPRSLLGKDIEELARKKVRLRLKEALV